MLESYMTGFCKKGCSKRGRLPQGDKNGMIQRIKRVGIVNIMNQIKDEFVFQYVFFIS